MIKNDSQLQKFVGSWAMVALVFLFVCGSASSGEYRRGELGDKLSAQVRDFDNQGQPLIQTLLGIAERYDLPMGIERVVRQGLAEPITVRLRKATVARLLDLCVRKLPGYSWAVRDGAVLIYGANELNQPSNLFNFVISSFEGQNETLNRANAGLQIKLYVEKEKANGYVGSFPGSNEFDDKGLSLNLHNATVRQILNRLVALHGRVSWIARVPPEGLSRIPQAGLWTFLPRSVRDPQGSLDESLRRDAVQK